MAGRRALYLTVLLCCLGFYIAYQQWLAWFLLLLVVVLPWFSLLISLPAMLRFRVEVGGPRVIRMGIGAEAQLLGWCSLPVPPFRGRLRLTRMTTGESWKRRKALLLPTEHCGALEAVPERVRVYDYLGLIGLPVKAVGKRTLLVRPEPVRIPELPELKRFLARAWRPKPGGGFAENHELRLYRPGDGLNQIHWKLTAKTGKLIIREPVEPERGLVLVTMNLRGSPEVLDQKFGKLLWLGNHLLELGLAFRIQVLTGSGVRSFSVTGEPGLWEAVDSLLCEKPVAAGDLRNMEFRASWHYHIGGEIQN